MYVFWPHANAFANIREYFFEYYLIGGPSFWAAMEKKSLQKEFVGVERREAGMNFATFCERFAVDPKVCERKRFFNVTDGVARKVVHSFDRVRALTSEFGLPTERVIDFLVDLGVRCDCQIIYLEANLLLEMRWWQCLHGVRNVRRSDVFEVWPKG